MQECGLREWCKYWDAMFAEFVKLYWLVQGREFLNILLFQAAVAELLFSSLVVMVNNSWHGAKGLAIPSSSGSLCCHGCWPSGSSDGGREPIFALLRQLPHCYRWLWFQYILTHWLLPHPNFVHLFDEEIWDKRRPSCFQDKPGALPSQAGSHSSLGFQLVRFRR